MDITTPPQGCTNQKLRQLTRQVSQHYDAELARCGLTGSQYSLLSHLLKLCPMLPGELARALRMDASTLTRNLRPLQAAGWLQVLPGADARSRSVQLTELGHAKRDEAKAHWLAAQRALNDRLGADFVAGLHGWLDEAMVKLGDMPMPDRATSKPAPRRAGRAGATA